MPDLLRGSGSSYSVQWKIPTVSHRMQTDLEVQNVSRELSCHKSKVYSICLNLVPFEWLT